MIEMNLPEAYRIFLRAYLGLPLTYRLGAEAEFIRLYISDDALGCLKYACSVMGWSLASGFTTDAMVNDNAEMIRFCFERDFSLYEHELEKAMVKHDARSALDALPLYPWNFTVIALEAWLRDRPEWLVCAQTRLNEPLHEVVSSVWNAPVFPKRFPTNVVRLILQHKIAISSFMFERLIRLGAATWSANLDSATQHVLKAMVHASHHSLSSTLCGEFRRRGYLVAFIPFSMCDCRDPRVHPQ